MIKKGILIGGGFGTRLRPMTLAVSKHLLAVHDKPMIYYPLTTLLALEIRDILLITQREDYAAYKRLLGDGERFGVNLQYSVQSEKQTLAKNINSSAHFIDEDPVCVILGDNFFDSPTLVGLAKQSVDPLQGAVIVTTSVQNPSQFGVLFTDEAHNPVRIEEKPKDDCSNLAITGLYFYDSQLTYLTDQHEFFGASDINAYYLQHQQLHIIPLAGQWYDLGTVESLANAEQYVKNNQTTERLIGAPEWVAWQKKYIDETTLKKSLLLFKYCTYGKLLLEIFDRQ